MGIRVDAEALSHSWQSLDARTAFELFHKMLIDGELPLPLAAALAKAVFACCC